MVTRASSFRVSPSNGLQQALWHDSIYDALGAAVQAAGGVKAVAGKLWPTLGSDVASARLRGGLNPEHAQKLAPEDVMAIAALARAVGDHSVGLFIARDLAYELTPLDPADAEKRARKARRAALLAELQRLEEE